MFELFVSKYLSGVPVNKLDKLSALSTIKTIIIETFNLFFFSTNQMSFRGEPNSSLQKIYFHDISLNFRPQNETYQGHIIRYLRYMTWFHPLLFNKSSDQNEYTDDNESAKFHFNKTFGRQFLTKLLENILHVCSWLNTLLLVENRVVTLQRYDAIFMCSNGNFYAHVRMTLREPRTQHGSGHCYLGSLDYAYTCNQLVRNCLAGLHT